MVAGSRREAVQLARAQVAAAVARRDQAQAALDRLRITAPVAGEILQVKVRAGEYYQPGAEPLVVMGDTSHLAVRLDVDERDVGRVTVGAAVIARANAFPGVDFTGKVVELGRRMGRKNVRSDDPAERNDTKILEVVVALDRPGGLVVGQRVTAYVVEGPAARPDLVLRPEEHRWPSSGRPRSPRCSWPGGSSRRCRRGSRPNGSPPRAPGTS